MKDPKAMGKLGKDDGNIAIFNGGGGD